ncbi:pullulanase-type alpha-1,6-glucosidase [Thalassotalea ganghwensis]
MRTLLAYLLLTLTTLTAFATHVAVSDKPSSNSLSINQAGAHWVTPSALLVAANVVDHPQSLISQSLNLQGTWQIDQRFPLRQCQTPTTITERFPHLAGFSCFAIESDLATIKALIKQPLAVINQHGQGTTVQKAALIDDIYTSGNNDANEAKNLGAQLTTQGVNFKLWAPTALSVKVLLFDNNKQPITPHQLALVLDDKTGIWSRATKRDFSGYYYQYQLTLYHPSTHKIETTTTTDPYSLSLSTNSEYSQIVDLTSSNTMPKGWLTQRDNPVSAPEDNIFYETHIRDFSALDSSIKDTSVRGKYLAFSQTDSDGVKHLQSLKQAGINSIHLLPAFDIGTINEDSNTVVDLFDNLKTICDKTQLEQVCAINSEQSLYDYIKSLPPTSTDQQALISALRGLDNYNWGYDPFHYTVPEGSYAKDPEGIARIIEFRTMVQTLHNMGFRVIMDVVYNHTHQAGLMPTAVLDKIVPNYYHRLDPITGKIAQSTCCDNTATERAMMEKLMIDSLVVWAKHYRIDGFRFDLMGHQPKAAMLNARQAVWEVDPDNYFYGEGWNFGEVANNHRFIQASQLELAGTEIGTFTDRLRDAVRGGAFNAQGDDIRKSQGIANGLATFPNELSDNNDKARYLELADLLRIGLTGNLANYPLLTAQGEVKQGKALSYGGQPSGYALDPADTINYVSKHDNQTLWDNNQYRIAYQLTTEQRVRMQLLALAYPLFSQGIPFIHMGSELLRSKGFLRDSYDYGDWFNGVDFSLQSNNYTTGLPPAEKDQQNWSTIKNILMNNNGRDIPKPNDIAFSRDVFLDFVTLRMSEPLFRLNHGDDIIKQVKFHNTGQEQTLGLIAMSISPKDNEIPSLLVLFNHSGEAKTLSFKHAAQYQLHPILQRGADDIVKTTQIQAEDITVPALTVAVLNRKQMN